MIKNGKEEFIKGKFLSDTHIMGLTPSKMMLYDVRKPSIILSEISQEILFDECSEENELNDFDFTIKDGLFRFCCSFDSGDIKIFDYDLSRPSDVCWLKKKHSNICLKCHFSGPDLVYSLGFDFKFIQWNLSDIANKSQSRNIVDQLKSALGPGAEKTLQYNPPYGYCISNYQSLGQDFLLVGLGNGSVMKFKKKKLTLAEVYSDIHTNQICGMIVDAKR